MNAMKIYTATKQNLLPVRLPEFVVVKDEDWKKG